jgi:hypothetical protein
MSNEKIFEFQASADPSVGRQLLDEHSYTINQHIKKWSGVLPEIVLKKHAESFALDAFKSFDPSKGAQIQTHMYNHLQRLGRLNYANQNIAKIPEHHIRNISKVNDTENMLTDTLGREPSHAEIAKHLKIPVSHVKQVKMITRSEYSVEGRDEELQTEGTHAVDNELVLKLNDTISKFNDDDRQKFGELTGYGNVKQLKPHEFGAKHNLKPYEVSRYKNLLGKRLEKGIM